MLEPVTAAATEAILGIGGSKGVEILGDEVNFENELLVRREGAGLVGVPGLSPPSVTTASVGSLGRL